MSLVTNDKKIYEKCLFLRNLYFNNSRRFKHFGLGWNYRLDEISCALGISQISKLRSGINKRRNLVKAYRRLLKNKDYI